LQTNSLTAVQSGAGQPASAGSGPAGVSSSRLVQSLVLASAAWAGMYSRAVLGPLQETVKSSLLLSDNQMAILQGTAMAVPMVLGSIPLGIVADRVSRARMLIFFLALAIASFLLTAIAPRFSLLLPARCLAGLASVALMIAAFSLVSDLYAPAERGRASMVLVTGEILGSPAAFAFGGKVLVLVGSTVALTTYHWNLADWRWAVLWMGVPLIPILCLLILLVREPARHEMVQARPRFLSMWSELWQYRRVVTSLLFARAMVWIADGAIFVWGAPLFARKFGLKPDRVGALMGLALLVSGVLGPALGGPLADFCQRRSGPRRAVKFMAATALIGVPAALFPFMPTAIWMCVLLAVFVTLGISILTAGVAVSIVVIPGELRGVYLGITYTAGALFFMGLAPLVVSELSGILGGERMIGPALAMVCATASLAGAAIFWSSAAYFPGASTET